MFRFIGSKKALTVAATLSLVFAGMMSSPVHLLAGPLPLPDDIIKLGFVVLDDQTSQPIKGAAVRLIDAFGNASDDSVDHPTLSDDKGRAVLSRDFDPGHILNDVKDGNLFRVYGWRVKVTAEGYRSSRTPLFEHTPRIIDYRTPKVENPTIRLHRSIEAESKSGPEADTFVYREFGIRTSIVLYGNKFDVLRTCPKLCSQHTPWFEAQFGEVKEADGVLQLKVGQKELIPRRDGEDDKWLLNDLVRVRWGRREYLIAEKQGVAFCNAVNLGEEPRKSDYGDFALGEGQEAIDEKGSPEVPKRWSGYLLKAPVQGEVIQLLPDLKARLNVGRKHGLRAGMELVPTEEYLFSDMEIVSVEEGESIISTKYPNGMYRKIRVGDIVRTRQPSAMTNP